MKTYKIIGNMTGNSMDAIDLVLTAFQGNNMTDICSYTRPYSREMQDRMSALRDQVLNKTAEEILSVPDFMAVHNDYIREVADCINEMCAVHNLDKKEIDAIGFHGKTLDHNPPSKARIDRTEPYTLQMGSGQMLADLTGIPVVYDFRSDPIMAGFDGAPLIPPHNAHIAETEGDGCYYNGGNTSNFAIIQDGKAVFGSDAGPFNEYTDNFMRLHTGESFDKDGAVGKQGHLDKALLQKMFDFGRSYYETPLPKSGDPAYYHRDEVFRVVAEQGIPFADSVRTFEYFAAYIAAYTLTQLPADMTIPNQYIVFGGGWKNPIVKADFEALLSGKGFVLPEHEKRFSELPQRIGAPSEVRYSRLGEYMEARLFADLARYKLEEKAWEIPEVVQAGQKIVCGRIAKPRSNGGNYTDCLNRAVKGWQRERG